LRADGIDALFNAIRPAGFDLLRPLNVSKTSVNFMRNYHIEIPENLENTRMQVMTDAWKNHPFYQSAVVLGLDIGLKGIGVCVRRGPEIVYAKTWVYNVPEAARLEDRRANRAARHCRANRRIRLNRLKKLMAMHALPWVEEESRAMRATDPFVLRHRAVTRQLAAREALSIAIRHCVAHRGYDYEYFSEEGDYPWGDATEFEKVKQALQTLWLTEADARKALADAAEFDDWSSSQHLR
jgi:CRISPR/Cas system Type II protein with McrA/HNH and RuvC-like nuclease domain